MHLGEVRRKGNADMIDAGWEITRAELDDLARRMHDVRPAAQGIGAAIGGGDLVAVLAAGVKRPLLVFALRYDGEALTGLLRHFSGEATVYLTRNSQRLADFLEQAENWSVAKITVFLEGCGVPTRYARETALITMALAG